MKRSLAWTVPFLSLAGCGYNTLVEQEQRVDASWAQVENQLQRRADLIPNLVATVKGYAAHEQKVFSDVADARSRLLSAQGPAAKAEAEAGLNGALGRLLAISEQYPQLKADATFTRLMDELSGTENRLATERMRYNEAVEQYNAAVKRIPTAWTASIFGFPSHKEYFKAAETAKEVPKVDFGK